LFQLLTEYQLIYNHSFEISSSFVADRISSNSSLLQLSLACRSDPSISSYHPCIGYLATFIINLVSELLAFTISSRTLNDDVMLLLIKRLSWLWRFVHICIQPMNRRSKDDCISELAMHWNWMHEQLLVVLESVGVVLSPRLQETIHQLHMALGTDGRLVKIQETVRTAFGKPAPFKNMAESVAYASVNKISRHLTTVTLEESNGKGTLNKEVEQLKVKLILDMASFGLESSIEEMNKTMESIGNALNSGMDTVNCETDCRLMLNPLFECLALHYESQLAANSNGSILNGSALKEFVKFSSTRTAVSIMSLIPWSTMAVAVDSAARQASVGSCLLVHFTRLMLTRAIPEPPSVHHLHFHSLNLSDVIRSLISNYETKSKSDEASLTLPGLVTLGDSDSRLLQLSTLARALWLNAGVIDNHKWDILANNHQLCVSVLTHLLSALRCQLSVTLQKSVEDLVIGRVSSSQFAEVLEGSSETDSSLSVLLPNWKLEISQCILCLDKVSSSKGRDSHYVYMSELGEAWVQLGLFQCQLLAPRGPVDPNYRLSVSLNYAVGDLEKIDCEVDLRKWYESLLTGVDQLHTTHPFITDLFKQQQELKGYIEHKSKLVAFRSEHVQFLRLLQDVEQFMGGIGSSERISNLAIRLHSSMSDERLVDSALQEQKTILQSFNSFMSRIELEYQNYRDLTVPFLSALAQVQHGLNLIATAVHIDAARKRLDHGARSYLEDIVRVVGSFPTVSDTSSVRKTVEALVSNELHSFMNYISLGSSSAAHSTSVAVTQSRYVLFSLIGTNSHFVYC